VEVLGLWTSTIPRCAWRFGPHARGARNQRP
jgi:hypothetical protein